MYVSSSSQELEIVQSAKHTLKLEKDRKNNFLVNIEKMGLMLNWDTPILSCKITEADLRLYSQCKEIYEVGKKIAKKQEERKSELALSQLDQAFRLE